MSPTLNVALAGFGAVGKQLAERMDAGESGLHLTAISARDVERARASVAHFKNPPPVLSLTELVEHADVIVECAPAAVFRQLAEPVIMAGKTLIVLSSGALLDNWDLVELARQRGARIVVPTGALLGLDAVQAAALGNIYSVQMVTRKPVIGLMGAPGLEGRTLSDVAEPELLFKGSAAEAIKGYPANLNVAVALGLAGVGPERTHLEIWADPTVTRNTHRVYVKSDSADLTMMIENIPSENPKTGKITALSVLAALKKMISPLAIGV